MWHKAFVGIGTEPLDVTQEIREAFRAAFVAAGQPADIAMFVRHSLLPSGRYSFTVYFSPAAERLATRLVSAVPCMEPTSHNLRLLVGNGSAWDAWLEESSDTNLPVAIRTELPRNLPT